MHSTLCSDIAVKRENVPQVAGLLPAFVNIRESTSVVRVGLNIRFGAFGVPVAGRY